MAKTEQRLWEIDALRGIAIILMIAYHLMWDLNYLQIAEINMKTSIMKIFQICIASTFILLVGISLTLSYNKAKKEGKANFAKYLKRGAIIFSWGMLITLITWIFLREGFVIFGVLHLIGAAIILSYPFIEYKYINLLLGSVVIILGSYLLKHTFTFSWLMWLGLAPEKLYTVDYFPLMPWLGVVLIGVFLGNVLYNNKSNNNSNICRIFPLKDLSDSMVIRMTGILGKHSLIIYFIHQPILILLLYTFR